MIKKIMLLLALLLIVGCSQQIETDEDFHGDSHDSISPESLNEDTFGVKVLDVRSLNEYESEHIKGAFALPLDEISESKLNMFGFDKMDEIITYANSDISARKARTLLEVMGYEDVKVLKGGFVHWKEDGFLTVSGKMDVVFDTETRDKESSLSLMPLEHDFGDVLRTAGIVETTFTFSNEGSEIVTVDEISTSCGCTTAEVSSEKILPGEEVSLKVYFDPDFHKEPMGRFSRTVFVQTSEGVEIQAKIWVEIIEE